MSEHSKEKILIKAGKVLTPSGARISDVLIEDGKISSIKENLSAGDARTVDAKGMWVVPGLVDIHCHLREPGFEYKEDIASGTAAAAKGGFTSICCMANTDPVNDSPVVTEFIRKKARDAGPIHVHPIAALTKGLKGEQLTEVGELAASGAVALSDDGVSVRDANRLRLGLAYAKRFGLKVVSHPEDLDLTNGGLMNEGYWSTALGLAGITRAAEETIIARDCAIAELEDAPIHIAHVSTRGGAEVVRAMKKRGLKVTAETAPHYLYATDEWVRDYDTNTKVNPPLRTDDDQTALIEALRDGTIDCIATDHAPHHIDEKNVEFALAANGISGFETAFGICWTALVKPGHLTPEQLFEKMTSAPAAIFNLDAGVLEEGRVADVAVIDPEAEWVVDPKHFLSRGKNTPFTGRTLTGLARCTIAGGEVAYEVK
ncbi:dihydroorotase [Synergistaceae bacterium OttesenSCG-928-I11]|nr:dihydroorotase [Synergistaceae bacterium OttesenSCG-928-I11]